MGGEDGRRVVKAFCIPCGGVWGGRWGGENLRFRFYMNCNTEGGRGRGKTWWEGVSNALRKGRGIVGGVQGGTVFASRLLYELQCRAWREGCRPLWVRGLWSRLDRGWRGYTAVPLITGVTASVTLCSFNHIIHWTAHTADVAFFYRIYDAPIYEKMKGTRVKYFNVNTNETYACLSKDAANASE